MNPGKFSQLEQHIQMHKAKMDYCGSLLIFLIGILMFGACTNGINKSETQTDEGTVITQVLMTQQASWNQGNIDEFMLAYWNSDSLRFYNSSGMTLGWQNTLDNYKIRYPNLDAMGQLRFDIDHLEILSPEIADVMGRYHLTRTNDVLSGYFTLIFRKIDGQWKIISDMTCAN